MVRGHTVQFMSMCVSTHKTWIEIHPVMVSMAMGCGIQLTTVLAVCASWCHGYVERILHPLQVSQRWHQCCGEYPSWLVDTHNYLNTHTHTWRVSSRDRNSHCRCPVPVGRLASRLASSCGFCVLMSHSNWYTRQSYRTHQKWSSIFCILGVK